jgi:hypothetical protein
LQDPKKFTQIGIFWSENKPSGNPAVATHFHMCAFDLNKTSIVSNRFEKNLNLI